MQATAPNEATRKLLEQLWQRNLPVLEERLSLLEEAATAAATGTLTLDLRTRAIGDAHKLAGSLGMFGYPRGTDIARELEVLFETECPNPAKLKELAKSLRAALSPGS